MAIRLAALDVDGTLLAPDNSITPATRQAIHEAKDAGLEIVVCTGRSFVEVQDILRQLPRVLNAGVDVNFYRPVTLPQLIENNRAFYSGAHDALIPPPPPPRRRGGDGWLPGQPDFRPLPPRPDFDKE